MGNMGDHKFYSHVCSQDPMPREMDSRGSFSVPKAVEVVEVPESLPDTQIDDQFDVPLHVCIQVFF